MLFGDNDRLEARQRIIPVLRLEPDRYPEEFLKGDRYALRPLALRIPCGRLSCASPAVCRGKEPPTIEGWGTIIDPSGDCTIRAADGKVTIESPAGLHDLWKGQKDETKRFSARG